MLITTVNNNKLYIHFDSIIKNVKVKIINDKNIEKIKELNNTEFGHIDIPKNSKILLIKIIINNTTINKTIKL
jgi:hypothetical protein